MTGVGRDLLAEGEGAQSSCGCGGLAISPPHALSPIRAKSDLLQPIGDRDGSQACCSTAQTVEAGHLVGNVIELAAADQPVPSTPAHGRDAGGQRPAKARPPQAAKEWGGPTVREPGRLSRTMLDTVVLQRLLSRVALGDRKAFRALYDATSPSLFGVAIRMLNRRDRAEEVIQDAFVNVWQRAASYSVGASQPMTWLTAIVRNRALDVLRSESARPAELLHDVEDGEGHEPADERPDPLGLLERAVDEVRIRDCLGDIQGPQRQCLALAYYHGLSHSEVAAQLAAPIGSVKVWIRRGLDRLKRCLDRSL